MNGQCGDIGVKHITEDKFNAYPMDQKLWILYNFMQSIGSTCHSRQEACDSKYMPRCSKKMLIGVVAVILAAIYGPDIFREDSPLWKLIMALV